MLGIKSQTSLGAKGVLYHHRPMDTSSDTEVGGEGDSCPSLPPPPPVLPEALLSSTQLPDSSRE